MITNNKDNTIRIVRGEDRYAGAPNVDHSVRINLQGPKKNYIEGNSLTYVRNPDYWGKATIGGKEYSMPFVDKVVCPIIPDVSTQIAALRTGKVDLMVNVSWEYWDSLAKTNPELKKLEYPHGRTFVLFLRCDKPPMNDIRVRKALWMAIDRTAVGNSAYGGKWVPLNYPIHSTAAGEGFTPIENLPPETQEMFGYNPKRAKDLLAEAGYANGFNASVTIRSQDVTLMPMIVDYWKNIGVNCEIKVVESGAFWGIKADKTYDMIMYPDAWTGLVWQMRGFTSEASWNMARWLDSYFDKQFGNIRKTIDPVKRTAMIKDLGVYLIGQSPVLTMPAQYSSNYWQPWVRNYHGESAASFANFGALMSVAWTEKD